jgi:cupin superfamily protein
LAAEPAVAGSPALERCVGDVDGFAREYWARAPLYRPGADAAAFRDLLGVADVDHLISSVMLRTPAFRLVSQGKPLAPGTYTKSGRVGSRPVSDLADPGKVYEHFRRGATIVLQSLHRYWPPLTRFCRELELAITHPVQVNVYATPPASQGLGVHHDSHDVFVLQVYGRKRWDVYEVGDDTGTGETRIAAELRPGDAMYIPTTFPHAARTAETASIHLTIGILTTTWRDVLSRCADEVLTDAAYAQPLPIGYADRPSALGPAVADQLRELASRLDKLDPGQVAEETAGRFWSSRPPMLDGQLQQLLALEAIDDATVLRRRPGAVCHLGSDGEQLVLALGDRELRVPGWLEPAIRHLLEAEPLAVGDLAEHLDPQSRLVLARRLVREGLFLADV